MIPERQSTIETLERWRMRRIDIAALAGVTPSRVTDYLRKRSLPRAQELAIARAVADVARVWVAFFPYRILTSDPAVFRRAVAEVDAALAGLANDQEPQTKILEKVGT